MTLNKKVGALFGAALALTIATAWSTYGVAAPARGSSAATATPIAGDPFQVKTEVLGDCKAGAECTAKITINVTEGEYHVNDQYPFKFTASAEGVEFHGSGGNVFQGGDFIREKKSATMTVKFKPSAKGNLTIAGKYKICVCTEKTCQPQTIDVSIPVTVK
jgi:hypothetical protein